MLVNNNSTLNILATKDNKVLQEVLKQADSKTLENMLKNEKLSSSEVLKNLFLELKTGNKTNIAIENILKNSNLFKNEANFSKLLTNLLKNLDGTNLISYKESILNFSKNMDQFDSKTLKEQINNSGLFLENKLLQKSLGSEVKNIQSDLKSVLLQLQKELENSSDSKSNELLKQTEKLLTQIDYHQLLSIVSNSNNVYIPFFWEFLDEGSIDIKKSDEEKFYCQIQLSLKEFGKVYLMLGLYDKNKLDLNIHMEDLKFKEFLQKNISSLKTKLKEIDIIPINLKFYHLKKEEKIISSKFNQYEKSLNFNQVDLKV